MVISVKALQCFYSFIKFAKMCIAKTSICLSKVSCIWSFYIGAAILILCVIYTTMKVKEWNPQVMLPPNALGKLDVGGAVGHGILNVIKDMGMKEPYVGQVGLQTGEIAEDLTYYFATSEQVASSVGLGVLMNHDNTVRQAGGFIIQLMPFTDEKVIDALEKKLSSVKSVTSMLDAGMTPEDILQELLGEFGVEITEKTETRFACNCSKERMEKALISIGRKDLEEMIKDGEPIEMNCHFCNSHYQFSVEELKKILAQAKKR